MLSRASDPDVTQIAEAEREIAAYSACFAQMQMNGDTEASTSAGNHVSVQSEPGRGSVLRDAEEFQLEEISRLEQELVQERCGREGKRARSVAGGEITCSNPVSPTVLLCFIFWNGTLTKEKCKPNPHSTSMGRVLDLE